MELCSFSKKKQDHKKILCIFLSLLFIIININISFADDVEFIQISTTEDFTSNPTINYSEVYYTASVDIYPVADEEGVFCFMVSSPSGSNTKHTLYFESSHEFRYNQYNGSIWQLTTATATLKETGFYEYVTSVYSGPNYGSKTFNNITEYSSYEEGISALNAFLSASSWSGSATVSVEAGCVAYILVDGGTANLTTTFPELSKLSRPLWVSGSTYSFEEDLPSSGKVFSSTSGTLIDWLIPANAKKDLLGRSYVGGRPLSDLPSGQFLVIYNPVYRGYDDKGVGIMSPTIYVTLTNYVAVRQYRLTASYNGGLIESTSEDGYTSWFDSIGEEELDANGNPTYIEHKTDGTTSSAINIPAGGGNIIIDTENADNSLGGLLQRLVNLLSAPVRYIENLFNAGVGFFTMLASLWSWLPSEVSTIIASALIVLVVIGVVKFLWK